MSHTAAHRLVVRRLLAKPLVARALYRVAIGMSDNDVDAALTDLVTSGVLACTGKRFWIRDYIRAMKIANGD